LRTTTLFVPTHSLGTKPGWITNERHRDADDRLLTSDELRLVQQSGLIGSHRPNVIQRCFGSAGRLGVSGL